MFGWEFPPHNSGGLGVACQGLARALSKNVELTFVLPRKLKISEKGFKLLFADVPDAKLIGLDSLLVPYVTSEKYSFLRGIDPNGNYGATLFEEVRRYAILSQKVAGSENFDVIHAHDWLSFGAGIEAKKVSGKPLVVHVHATEVDRTAGNPNRFIYQREREGVLAADKVLSVSQFTKDVLVKHYGVSERKVEVVHNGIDKDRYFTNESPNLGVSRLKELGYKIVLYYGRITIMKGVDHLINAANLVLKYNPKTLFVIVGSGDMEGQIMSQSASMGISKNVLFPGFLRGRELSSMIKAADLFVMPSISEPFGLTSLESLIHGTPVLMSKQSGVSEVLKNTLKADFWDVDDMADKILSVINHSSLKKELTSNGKREVYLCTWDKAAEKCLSVYNNL